jgi:hypothetical protein
VGFRGRGRVGSVAKDGKPVPGALRIAPEEIGRRWRELPSEKAVVAYCT